MKRARSIPILVAFLLAAGLARSEGFGLDSYQKARAVLDAAAEAAGGAERLEAIHAVDLERDGTSYGRNQSPEPAPPYTQNPVRSRAALDFEHGWSLFRNSGQFSGGIAF